MTIPIFRPRRIAAAVATLARSAPLAQGAAFALQENNASGLGNAYAGGAAIAEDASTVWCEPGGHVAAEAARGGAGDPLHHSVEQVQRRRLAAGAQPAARHEQRRRRRRRSTSIPNLYVVVPYNQQLVFGLGVNVPFGLTTEYDDGWIGRYHGIKSQVKTINVQPTVSWKVNDQLSRRARHRLPVDRRAADQRRELLRRRSRRARSRPLRPG